MTTLNNTQLAIFTAFASVGIILDLAVGEDSVWCWMSDDFTQSVELDFNTNALGEAGVFITAENETGSYSLTSCTDDWLENFEDCLVNIQSNQELF